MSGAPATGVSLLEVRDLCTWFGPEATPVRAVDGVSLTLERRQTVALVGESGCGKSVTGLSIMRLVPAGGHIIGGEVRLDGKELIGLDHGEMTRIRGRRMSMVFQEPMTSLNPLMTVGEQIAEMLRYHLSLSRRQAIERSVELLDEVGFARPKRLLGEYPHRLSGGMRQRVMIAMALSCDPELLIADEPTTALDVTIQAQVLELLKRLAARVGTTVLLITHDLAVVSEVADHVYVMYAGLVVESAPTRLLFSRPLHPYTQGLLACVTSISEAKRRLRPIRGTVPAPDALPPGCRFAPRCPRAFARCPSAVPPLVEVEEGHQVRCYLHPGGAA